ncbi:MAG: NAD(P)-dependent oxidoreductase [Thermoplasmatales archaeon]|nr:NAD(P)-dependent oxidoreductase [Thermoplasmatales archaeon]
MRVFITGGTGFIGTHLIKNLQDSNHDILLLTLEGEELPEAFPVNIKTIEGNLSNIDKWQNKIEKFQPDATIHMAWEGLPNYDYKTSARNLEYGIKFITMLSEVGCKRVICTGSCWEYGKKHGKISEDEMPVSTNSFTAAKNALNIMGHEIAKENNMNFIWTRLFYVYGSGQRSYSLIPHIINCIKNGKKPEIKTPDAKNDFVYAEDVVNALSMILEKCNKSTVYNIGSGHSTSVKDVVEIVCQNYDFDCKISSDHQVNKSSVDFYADISKIKKETGWEPKTSIQEGIKNTVKYY